MQKEVFQQVHSAQLKGGLVVCRHYPVITLGRLANKANILISEEELKDRKIDIYEIERGGDVTYHGPGQITVYPIINLNYLGRDIHRFLRQLEEVVIELLCELGVFAMRRPGLTGIWVRGRKVASIGIAVKKWITCHGLSLNIKNDDLANFTLIRPCGMDIEMTSIESILSRYIEIDRIKQAIIDKFENTFSVNMAMVS